MLKSQSTSTVDTLCILLVEKGRQKFASRVEKSWVRFNPLTISKLYGGRVNKNFNKNKYTLISIKYKKRERTP